MKRNIWLILIVVLVGYLLATSVVAVKETEIVVISQFGRPVDVVDQAGPAFKLPDPIQTVRRLDKRLQYFKINPAEFGTLDRRNLVLDVFVVWKISNPELFLASVRNNEIAQQRLETLTNAEVGAAIGAKSLDSIFSVSDKGSLVGEAFSQITRAADIVSQKELGIQIVSIKPNRMGFPKQNLLAIYKRMESEWDKLSKQYRAEGQEEAARIRAETDLEVRSIKAKAYSQAQIVKGNSEAEAARLYAESFEANSDYYQFTRSLESYNKILNENSQLILSSENPIFSPLLQPPQQSDKQK